MRKTLKKVLVGVLLTSQIVGQIPVFASELDTVSGNSISFEESNEVTGVLDEPALDGIENTEGNETIEEVIEELEETEDNTEIIEEVTEEIEEEFTEELIEEATEEITEETLEEAVEEAPVEEETLEEELTEEETLEETTEETVGYPEFSGTIQTNGVDCSFSAEEGVVPDGAKLVFGEVSDVDAIGTAIMNDLGENNSITSLKAFEIDLYDADDTKIQPNGEVVITFEYADSDAELLKVYYFDGAGVEEMSSCPNNGSITLNANHFSKYIVAGVKENAVMTTANDFTVTFKTYFYDEEVVDTQIVPKGGTVTFPRGILKPNGSEVTEWYIDSGKHNDCEVCNINHQLSYDLYTDDFKWYANYAVNEDMTLCYADIQKYKLYVHTDSSVNTYSVSSFCELKNHVSLSTYSTKKEFLGWYSDDAFTTPFELPEHLTQDTHIYAKFGNSSTNVCEVRYYDSDNLVRTDSLRAGSMLTAPQITKAGYTLEGWYKEPEFINKWNFDTDTVTGQTKLYAMWVSDGTQTYTVSFPNAEANWVDYSSIEMKPGTKIMEALNNVNDTEINKAGYVFVGWFKDAACTELWDLVNDTVDSDVAMYAGFKEEVVAKEFMDATEFNVIAKLWDSAMTTYVEYVLATIERADDADYTIGGVPGIDEFYEAGSTTIFNATPILDSSLNGVDGLYKLIGDAVKMVNWLANMQDTVYFDYVKQPETYFVNFEENGGTTVNDVTVVEGSSLSEPTSTKQGAQLEGWYTDMWLTDKWDFATGVVNSNITLYAKWVCVVEFEENGGTAVANAEIKQGTLVTEPTITKDGCNFEGWYTDPSYSTQWNFYGNTVSESITLYARWTCNVNFVNTGDTYVSGLTVDENTKITEPTVSRAGYELEGWYSDSSYTTKWNYDNDTVSESITLYARWNCTVSFETFGGTAVADMKVAENSNITEPTTSKAGHELEGWYTDSYFNNRWDFTNDIVYSSMTLYANWQSYYTVSFETNGGTAVADVEVLQGSQITEPTTSKTGYNLEGWYTDSSFTNKWNFNYDGVSQDMTLYAKWVSYCTIKFEANGGTAVADAQVLGGTYYYGNTYSEKEGHYLVGWFTDVNLTTEFDFYNNPIVSDITLYAKWDAYTYEVFFNSRGGSSVPIQEVIYGSLATEPVVPTKSGYTFGGWYKDYSCQNQWDFANDTVVEHTTLFAKWNEDHSVYFFNSNDEMIATTQVVPHGGLVTRPADPVMVGYTFDGWYTERSCTNKWDFANDTVLSNKALYGKFERDCTVDFNTMGGTNVDSQTIAKGGLVVEPSDPTKSGYTFGGWYKELNCINAWNFATDTVNTNTIIYAKWVEVPKYTVSFDSMGGSSVAAQQIVSGGKAMEPVAPTKLGHTFEGWYQELSDADAWDFSNDTVVNDIILYAKWRLVTYNITFDSMGGSSVEAKTIMKDSIVPKPVDPIKAGYTFDGWFKESNCINEWNFATEKPTGDITLYAKWVEIPKYTVNFDTVGGSVVLPQEIENGNKVSKPEDPTKSGYSFAGWYKDVNYTNAWDFANDTVTNDVTLFAKWLDNTVVVKYTVSFESNGGSAVNSQEILKDGVVTEPSEPTKTDYTFKGWFEDTELTDAWDFANDKVTKDITLYAKWEEIMENDPEDKEPEDKEPEDKEPEDKEPEEEEPVDEIPEETPEEVVPEETPEEEPKDEEEPEAVPEIPEVIRVPDATPVPVVDDGRLYPYICTKQNCFSVNRSVVEVDLEYLLNRKPFVAGYFKKEDEITL